MCNCSTNVNNMFYFKLSLKESEISMCDYDIFVFTSHFPCISAVCAFMKVETKTYLLSLSE